MTDLASLYRAKVSEYARVRWDLGATLAAEKRAWFEVIESLDATETSVAARREEADLATVTFRSDALKLQARADGLAALCEFLRALISAGHVELPPSLEADI